MARGTFQVCVPNRPVLGHIPGAVLRSGALLPSEGVNVNSRHALLQLAHKLMIYHWNGIVRSSEFQDGCTLCRRVRRLEPHCTSSPLPFFLNDFPTAVDFTVSLRLSLVPEFSCRSKPVMAAGGGTCDFSFLWSIIQISAAQLWLLLWCSHNCV